MEVEMKARILILISMIILGLFSQSCSDNNTEPAPTVYKFTQTFGGSGGDYGESVSQTSDGGYIIAGATSSYGAGNRDFWLIKTDIQGNWEWENTYGGEFDEYAYSVQQTLDGGYIITGETSSYGSAGSIDIWLVKTDDNGHRLWAKSFGGASFESAFCVLQSNDGGFVIAGNTGSYGAGGSDLWIIKANSSGTEEWNKTYGGLDHDYGTSIQHTSDGGFIILGSTRSLGAGGLDIYLIKIDSSGNLIWSKTFGGTDDDYGACVQQTSDGGFIIRGDTSSYGSGNSDFWIIKTDSSGNEEWNNTFGGTDNDWGYSSTIQQTTEGGYITTGETYSYGAGVSDVWLIKINNIGNEEWSVTFGGANDDYGSSVQQTNDGGYIVTGATWSFGEGTGDVWLIKTDENGEIE